MVSESDYSQMEAIAVRLEKATDECNLLHALTPDGDETLIALETAFLVTWFKVLPDALVNGQLQLRNYLKLCDTIIGMVEANIVQRKHELELS